MVGPYLSILLSTMLWSVATMLYATLGRNIGVRRLNFFKALFSLIFFFIATLIWGSFTWPREVIYLLLGSGFLGFALGDLFIFYGFSKMGAGRALMLTAFAPLFVLMWSHLLYDTATQPRVFLGVLALIACLFFLSLEKLKSFEVRPKVFLAVIFGISLESLGVVFSKEAFNLAPTLDAFSANFFRISISLVFLIVFLGVKRVSLNPNDITRRDLKLTILSSFLGTFLALFFYLNALSQGEAPVISALSNLSPIYAAIFDHVLAKRWPTKWFLLAIASMFTGLYFVS
ncbi:MAG TPA: DMT family transporter [Bdellovibrionota bacterium]|nr:DMT family transporter [Bdellovibrionota bacterium]